MPCARANLKLIQVSGCISQWHRGISQHESLPQSFRSNSRRNTRFTKNRAQCNLEESRLNFIFIPFFFILFKPKNL